MALTRATDKIVGNSDGNLNLSGIVTASRFSGTLVPSGDVNVGSNIKLGAASGVVTATSFSGDGSNLTSLPAGLGTALSSTQTSPLNKLYFTNEVLSIGATVTVDHPATSTGAYTQYADIRLEEGADLIIEDGDDVIPDILGLGTDGGGLGAGGSGRIRVDSITNKNANGAPNFPNGLTGTAGTFTTGTFSGAISAASGTITGNLGVGGVLTYEDVTNVDSVGLITARLGINLVSNDLNIGSNIKIGNASGIVTATSFSGDGSALTGINTAFGSGTSINTSGIITATAFVSDTPLSHRNMVINGASAVSQRYGTSSTNISGTAPQFVVDRFVVQTNVGGGTQSHQQVADAPAGFYYSQKVTSGTGGGNAGTAFARYRTTLEWQDVIPQSGFGTSSAKQLILSFYVKSSLTGTFGVAIQSYTNTRNIVNTYTINSANTWERKTVVIAADTDNAWVASTGVHLEIGWDLGEGTGRGTGTLNTWGAGLSGYGYNSGVKFFTQASATWQITGVQLEVGPVATPFEHRSFADELTRCRRYFYKPLTSNGNIYGGRWGNNSTHVNVFYPTQMRDTPTIGGNARRTGGTSYIGKDYFSYTIGQDDNWWENFTATSEL